MKVDTRLLVWDNGSCNKKYIRYFKEINADGKVVCFLSGRTSLIETGGKFWDNYELIKEEEN